MFNRGPEAIDVALEPVAWLPPSLVAYKSITVRDAWTRRNLARLPKSVRVASHGARLYRITAR